MRIDGNLLLDGFLLLGQAGPNAPKPGDWQFGWGGVGIVAGVSAGICLVAWLIMRWFGARERTISNSPWGLFKDLAMAHCADAPRAECADANGAASPPGAARVPLYGARLVGGRSSGAGLVAAAS